MALETKLAEATPKKISASCIASAKVSLLLCAAYCNFTLLNALEIQDKDIATAKLVCLGAGAAGIATLNLLCALGLNKNNVLNIQFCNQTPFNFKATRSRNIF
jgi:hypothetical protein